MADVPLHQITCCMEDCHVIFWITDAMDDRLREKHTSFYCPHGHSQSYLAKTLAEKRYEIICEKEREINRLNEELVKKCRPKKRIKNKQ